MIKELINQDDIKVANLYLITALKCLKQKLTELKEEKGTIGYFNQLEIYCFSKVDRITKESAKTNLNNMINYLDLTDIYRTLHPATVKCIFFSVHMVCLPG